MQEPDGYLIRYIPLMKPVSKWELKRFYKLMKINLKYFLRKKSTSLKSLERRAMITVSSHKIFVLYLSLQYLYNGTKQTTL